MTTFKPDPPRTVPTTWDFRSEQHIHLEAWQKISDEFFHVYGHLMPAGSYSGMINWGLDRLTSEPVLLLGAPNPQDLHNDITDLKSFQGIPIVIQQDDMRPLVHEAPFEPMYTARHRPIRIGRSIGSSSTFGTLWYLFVHRGHYYAVTCGHICPTIGQPVGQPGAGSEQDVIGHVVWTRLDSGRTHPADFNWLQDIAIVEITSQEAIQNFVAEIEYEYPQGILGFRMNVRMEVGIHPLDSMGQPLTFCGRTSGVVLPTPSRALRIHELHFNYVCQLVVGQQTMTCRGAILVSRGQHAYFGDSGAPVLNPYQAVVGMIQGGSSEFTCIMPAYVVLSALQEFYRSSRNMHLE